MTTLIPASAYGKPSHESHDCSTPALTHDNPHYPACAYDSPERTNERTAVCATYPYPSGLSAQPLVPPSYAKTILRWTHASSTRSPRPARVLRHRKSTSVSTSRDTRCIVLRGRTKVPIRMQRACRPSTKPTPRPHPCLQRNRLRRRVPCIHPPPPLLQSKIPAQPIHPLPPKTVNAPPHPRAPPGPLEIRHSRILLELCVTSHLFITVIIVCSHDSRPHNILPRVEDFIGCVFRAAVSPPGFPFIPIIKTSGGLDSETETAACE